MDEATKTRRLWGGLELGILRGKGIDIGCGADPVAPGVRPFELVHGDANVITNFVKEKFDFVFSAHCLEHMREPRAALREWWQLVKPGGHLFFIVPDEELYEQGFWPSVFNPEHLATFTLSSGASGSPVSVNVHDLLRSLPDGEVVDLRLQDDRYNRGYLRRRRCSPLWARLWTQVRWKIVSLLRKGGIRVRLNWFGPVFRVPIDQTVGDATAQIQVIVRKRAAGSAAAE